MELFEILTNMGHLCKKHNIIFKISARGFFIKKYMYYDGKPHNFDLYFSFDLLEYLTIDDCIEVFEIRFKEEISKRRNNED